MVGGLLTPAAAQAAECNDPFCTPGIKGGVALGAQCGDTGYYVFGTTFWGRLVFCGSPRRYEPRYWLSPPNENAVAQAPDGLFLTCAFENNQAIWVRGDA